MRVCVCDKWENFSISFSLYKNYLHIRFIHFSNLRKKGGNCSFLRYHFSIAAMRKFVCEIEFGKIVLSHMHDGIFYYDWFYIFLKSFRKGSFWKTGIVVLLKLIHIHTPLRNSILIFLYIQTIVTLPAHKIIRFYCSTEFLSHFSSTSIFSIVSFTNAF